MKKIHIKGAILALVLMIGALFSCKKYSYYQNNPNQPTQALPSLLFTNVCTSVFDYNFNNDGSAYAGRHMVVLGLVNNYENYGWTTGESTSLGNFGNFGNYDILRNVAQMNSLAQTAGQPVYTGLAHFFRAVLFSQLTEMFGDIPYSASLQATTGNTTPAYDTQEDVYLGVLNELDQANTILATAAKNNTQILGDVIYSGSALQWQKAINAFRLRLLIHLSKKTTDTKLNVIQQFQKIIGNPTSYPLMTGIADNAQIVFNTTDPSNYYPTYNLITVSTLMNLEQGFADTLITKSDPRLFAIALPISGKTAGVFANYAGVNAGLTPTDQQNASVGASLPAARYGNSMINEPLMLIGYPEQEFLIAEAISRGWITAGPGGSIGSTAKDCYNNGINGSMQFYNTWVSAGISDATIAAYQAQPSVAYNNAAAIQQIITQKYIAMFLQSDFEPFMEQRRTGIPTFDVGPGTLNNNVVPKRWQYPTTEYEQNGKNVKAAVQSQYSGSDNVNGVMWLLQ